MQQLMVLISNSVFNSFINTLQALNIMAKVCTTGLLTLFIILIVISLANSLKFIKSSEICASQQCPSNILYYFECCSGECCLRLQLIPSIIIAVVALILACLCCMAYCCYCCCGD